MHDQYGIAGHTAPEFRVDQWLDNVDGDLRIGRHGLDDIALGNDSGHPPTIMSDYRTGGTPGRS